MSSLLALTFQSECVRDPHPFGLRPVLQIIVYLLLAAVATGCAASRSSGGLSGQPLYSGERVASAPSRGVEALLRQEFERWKGTPHVLGGSTPAGMDCSAFVQRVFTDAFQVDLPRATEDQVNVGRRVARSDLQPGDLVFFRPATKTRHVGIYVSEGEFVHASSTEGVTISPLDLPYWQRAYWTSRRILDPTGPQSDGAVSDASSIGTPARATRGQRVGW